MLFQKIYAYLTKNSQLYPCFVRINQEDSFLLKNSLKYAQ